MENLCLVLILTSLIFFGCNSESNDFIYLNNKQVQFEEVKFFRVVKTSDSKELNKSKVYEVVKDPRFDFSQYGLSILKFEKESDLATFDSARPIEHRIGQLQTGSNNTYVVLTSNIVIKFNPEIDITQQNQILNNVLSEEKFSKEMVTREKYNPDYMTLSVPDSDFINIANTLHNNSNIEYAHPDFILKKKLYDSSLSPCLLDEYSLDYHWHHEIIGTYDGWCHTTGNSSTIIAIIDDAFDMTHEELIDNLSGSINMLHRNGNVNPGPLATDAMNQQHGTRVAGLAVASKNNGIPLGVCPDCSFFGIKSNASVNSLASYIRNQLVHEVKPSVISISWDYDIMINDLTNAFTYAAQRGRNSLGIPICIAIGNFGQDGCYQDSDLAAMEEVIAIGGSTYKDTVKPLNFGSCLDIVAPASNILSSAFDVQSSILGTDKSKTDYISNSSAATPLVAGAIGLMLSYDDSLDLSTIREILKTSTVKIYNDHAENPVINYCDGDARSKYAGYGRLDISNIFETLVN